MKSQFNPAETLWTGAVDGIGLLGTATLAILKAFMKSGYSVYVTGGKILTDAIEAVEDIAAEARAEIHAEHSVSRRKGVPRLKGPEHERFSSPKGRKRGRFLLGT